MVIDDGAIEVVRNLHELALRPSVLQVTDHRSNDNFAHLSYLENAV